MLLVPGQRARFDALLTEDEGGRRMAAEYGRHGTWRARMRGWARPPSIVLDEDTPRRFSWIYDTRGPDTVVLSIGGGPGRENPRAVNLNVDAFDSVDIVGDGTNVPLLDESVDTVTCNAVVEHVSDPHALLREMRRILKPGGYAQLMVPFVFPLSCVPGGLPAFQPPGHPGIDPRVRTGRALGPDRPNVDDARAAARVSAPACTGRKPARGPDARERDFRVAYLPPEISRSGSESQARSRDSGRGLLLSRAQAIGLREVPARGVQVPKAQDRRTPARGVSARGRRPRGRRSGEGSAMRGIRVPALR